MNSNAVYGHGPTVDYSQNCYPTPHELSYYNHSAADLSSSSSSSTAQPGYVPSALHMGHVPTTQFLDPGISDTNGLSYTNLDANGYPTSQSKLQHFSTNESQRSMSSAVISSAASHQSYSSHNSQYREFSSDSVPSSHTDISALSDCAVMRSSVPGSVPSAAQYPYLEPALLSRRSYGEPSAFDISGCTQLNGSTYHLPHIASHLQHHHHHHHLTNGRTNSVTAAANPVPTYKWMQVKRNVPKPRKYCCLVSAGRHSCTHLSYIRKGHEVVVVC